MLLSSQTLDPSALYPELSSQHQSESFGSSIDMKEPLDDEPEDINDGIVWQGLFGPINLNESKNS